MDKLTIVFIILEIVMSVFSSYKKEYSRSVHSLCLVILAMLFEIWLKLK